MRGRLLLLIGILAAAGCRRLPSVPPDNGPRRIAGAAAARVDAHLRALVPLGLSGRLVILRRGQTILDAAYGWADRRRAVPVTGTTVFDIASLSKAFTALAVYKLQDEGKLAVTDPLSRFLPNAPPDKRTITIAQLLTHRSGLPLYHDEGVRTMTRGDALRTILAAPLRFRPGSKYAYSNAGYTLLAAVIESASGTGFQEYVRSRILTPLQMNRTGWLGDERWPSADLAHGFARGKDRGPLGGRDGVTWTLLGAGGVVSCADDLSKLAAALFDAKVISPAAQSAMFGPSDECPSACGGDTASGWKVWTSARGSRIAEKAGYAGGRGFSSFLRIEPQERNAIILTLNSDWNETYPIGIHAVIVNLVERLLDAPAAPLPSPLERDDAPDGRFTAGASVMTIDDGVVSAEGQPLIDVLTDASEDEMRASAEANRRAAAMLAPAAANAAACEDHAALELKAALQNTAAARILGSTPDWVAGPGGVVTYVQVRKGPEERVLRLHWRGERLYCIGGGALKAPFIGEAIRGGILHLGLSRFVPLRTMGDRLIAGSGVRQVTLQPSGR